MAQKSILVIEDSTFVSTILMKGFQAKGFAVSVARDGREGLLRARHEKPDLVILDLVLPELPGEEVCRQIKKDPQTESIPVIMLTGKSGDADRVLGRVIGADAYIPKPFTMDALVEAVRKFLVVCVTVGLLASPFPVGAQDAGRSPAVPAGMELIKVGSTDVLVPRGTKVTKKDALLILEPPEQYMARTIEAMEEELKDLRQRQEELRGELAQVRLVLERLEKEHGNRLPEK